MIRDHVASVGETLPADDQGDSLGVPRVGRKLDGTRSRSDGNSLVSVHVPIIATCPITSRAVFNYNLRELIQVNNTINLLGFAI